MKSEKSSEENSDFQKAEKDLKLIARLHAISENNNKVDEEFQRLKRLLTEDYIKLAEQINLPNQAQIFPKIMQIKDELEKIIKFPFLANKKIVALGGAFGVGKSQFINSILGENILPVDVKEKTAIPSYIVQGAENKISTYNSFAQQIEINKKSLEAICNDFYEKYNLSFTKVLKGIIVQTKELSYSNLAFLDTPGYIKSDQKVARKHLQGADYLIWVVDIEEGTVSEQDIEFIKSLNFEKPLFVVLNKAEMKKESDIKAILEAAKKTLHSANIEIEGITAYSSLEVYEYFIDDLIEFLKKIDDSSKEVKLVQDLKDNLEIYLDYNCELIEERNSRLELFTELAVDSGLGKAKKNKLDELISAEKSELSNQKSLKIEFENLAQKVVESSKDILRALEIAYFDREEKGEELLLEIKKGGRKEKIEELIEIGASLDKQDQLGRTGLHWAVFAKDEELIEILIKAGADTSLQDNDGNKPLDIAKKLNSNDVFKFINEKGASEEDMISVEGLKEDMMPIEGLKEDIVLVEGGILIKKEERNNSNLTDSKSSDSNFFRSIGMLLENKTDMESENKTEKKDITITDFAIGKYPVTQKLYQQVMGENPSKFKGDNRPVESVTWWDAIEFCNKLSKREGLAVAYDLATGDLIDSEGKLATDITKVEGYRLPTEVEWKFAARGGNHSQGYEYAGSNNLDEVGWHYANSKKRRHPIGKTHPVGEKKANEIGLYDMSGNVWEWCHDWYKPGVSRKASGKNLDAAKKDCNRVQLGGSWKSYDYNAKIKSGTYNSPIQSNSNYGFRFAKSL